MKTKTFDCVEMKRQGAEMIQEKLQGKTMDEQLDYWRMRTKTLVERQKELLKSTVVSHADRE